MKDAVARRKKAMGSIVKALSGLSHEEALKSVLGMLSLAKLEDIEAISKHIEDADEEEKEEYTILVDEKTLVRYSVEATSHEAALAAYRAGNGVWGTEEVDEQVPRLVERSSDGKVMSVMEIEDDLEDQDFPELRVVIIPKEKPSE